MQELQITIKFKTEHNPGHDQHLREIAKNYLAAKGVTLHEDNAIVI